MQVIKKADMNNKTAEIHITVQLVNLHSVSQP